MVSKARRTRCQGHTLVATLLAAVASTAVATLLLVATTVATYETSVSDEIIRGSMPLDRVAWDTTEDCVRTLATTVASSTVATLA